MQSHHPARTVTIWDGNKFLPFKNNLPKQYKRITYGRHHSRSGFRTLFIFLLGLTSGPHSPTGLSRFHCIRNDPVLGGPEIWRGNHQLFPTVFIIMKIKHNFYFFLSFYQGSHQMLTPTNFIHRWNSFSAGWPFKVPQRNHNGVPLSCISMEDILTADVKYGRRFHFSLFLKRDLSCLTLSRQRCRPGRNVDLFFLLFSIIYSPVSIFVSRLNIHVAHSEVVLQLKFW